MGTNYYAHVDVCRCCGKADKVIHIGKKSYGWRFTFHAADGLQSWKQWRKLLRREDDVEIRSEEDEHISYSSFVKIVNSERQTGKNRYDCCRDEAMYEISKDPDGFCFDPREFC